MSVLSSSLKRATLRRIVYLISRLHLPLFVMLVTWIVVAYILLVVTCIIVEYFMSNATRMSHVVSFSLIFLFRNEQRITFEFERLLHS